MFSKRKSDYSDEEDEWEKEAASSSTFKKPLPPNPYAIQIDILDNQHKKLSETEADLEKQLKQLEFSLQELEEKEQLQHKKTETAKKGYLAAAKETINTYALTKDILLNETKDNALIDPSGAYVEKDTHLSDQIDAVVTKWHRLYQTQETETKNKKEVDSLSYRFRTVEFEIIDLVAQIDGYEARIQTLEKLKARLNGLPQLPHILKSEIDVFTARMKSTTQILAQLEKESIRPRLELLVQLRVILPIEKDQFRKKLEMLTDLINDLENLVKIAIQQRACQQLISYVYDRHRFDIAFRQRTFKHAKKDLENDLAPFILSHTPPPPPPPKKEIQKHAEEDEGDIHIAMIKNLLDEFFKNHHHQQNPHASSLVEQIKELKRLETTLERKWQDDFQSCLEAAQELFHLHQRLYESLCTYSSSKEDLIMTPKPYTDLQTKLQHRTDELEAAVKQLEKNAEDPDANALFEQQKKLFSLFFTDPITFEEFYIPLL